MDSSSGSVRAGTGAAPGGRSSERAVRGSAPSAAGDEVAGRAGRTRQEKSQRVVQGSSVGSAAARGAALAGETAAQGSPVDSAARGAALTGEGATSVGGAAARGAALAGDGATTPDASPQLAGEEAMGAAASSSMGRSDSLVGASAGAGAGGSSPATNSRLAGLEPSGGDSGAGLLLSDFQRMMLDMNQRWMMNMAQLFTEHSKRTDRRLDELVAAIDVLRVQGQAMQARQRELGCDADGLSHASVRTDGASGSVGGSVAGSEALADGAADDEAADGAVAAAVTCGLESSARGCPAGAAGDAEGVDSRRDTALPGAGATREERDARLSASATGFELTPLLQTAAERETDILAGMGAEDGEWPEAVRGEMFDKSSAAAAPVAARSIRIASVHTLPIREILELIQGCRDRVAHDFSLPKDLVVALAAGTLPVLRAQLKVYRHDVDLSTPRGLLTLLEGLVGQHGKDVLEALRCSHLRYDVPAGSGQGKSTAMNAVISYCGSLERVLRECKYASRGDLDRRGEQMGLLLSGLPSGVEKRLRHRAKLIAEASFGPEHTLHWLQQELCVMLEGAFSAAGDPALRAAFLSSGARYLDAAAGTAGGAAGGRTLSGGQRGVRAAGAPVECYSCGQLGHYSARCPNASGSAAKGAPVPGKAAAAGAGFASAHRPAGAAGGTRTTGGGRDKPAGGGAGRAGGDAGTRKCGNCGGAWHADIKDCRKPCRRFASGSCTKVNCPWPHTK